MNTRGLTSEFRMAHWAGIRRDRQESGLSVRAYCESAGFHENSYYYWQKKLREAACTELVKTQGKTIDMAPAVFAEVRLAKQPAMPPAAVMPLDSICIEAAGMRFTAGSEYPANKLAELLKAVAQSCC